MEELALRKEIEEKKRKERYHENESGLTDLGSTQPLEMTLSVLIYICMFCLYTRNRHTHYLTHTGVIPRLKIMSAF